MRNLPDHEALKAWTEILNRWYAKGSNVETNPQEVLEAFKVVYPGKDWRYIKTFFKEKDGSWSKDLDTADREKLAEEISRTRRPKQGTLTVEKLREILDSCNPQDTVTMHDFEGRRVIFQITIEEGKVKLEILAP